MFHSFFIILIFSVLIIFSILISNFLKNRIDNINEEILRKTPHILIGIIFSVTPFFMTKNEIIIFSIILFLGIFIKKYFSFFNSIFSIKRKSFGILFFPISLGILAFLWIPENLLAFIFGMLILTFSDSLAALFGKILGKKKIHKSEKTYLGTSIFFITTFFILLLTAKKINIENFIIISSILTFSEFILIYGFDNLFLPIIASYLFYFLI